MRFFYTLGVTVMILAFPSWFIAVVADNATAGAIGMLTFVLGVLLTAVGAAMDYRASQYEPEVVYPTREEYEAYQTAIAEAQQETSRIVGETIKGLNTPKDGWPRP